MEHQPVEFRPSPPGQPGGAILQKVTPLTNLQASQSRTLAGVKQLMLADSQQLIVFHVFTRSWASVCVSYFFVPVETGAPPFGKSYSFYIWVASEPVKYRIRTLGYNSGFHRR